MKELELKTYKCMASFRGSMLETCRMFNIDPRILCSLIYVEKNQEDVDIVRDWMRKAKTSLAFTATAIGIEIEKLVNCSFGYTHIKYDTVVGARRYLNNTPYRLLITDNDLKDFTLDVRKSIKLSAVIVCAILEWWRPVLDITEKPEIVGTIYNMVDFKRGTPKPKTNPKVGGSQLATVVDGEIIQDYFGNRVAKVYHSTTLKNFVQGAI